MRTDECDTMRWGALRFQQVYSCITSRSMVDVDFYRLWLADVGLLVVH
jgi:hypothetical protein